MLIATLFCLLACQESIDVLLEKLGSADPAQRNRASEALIRRWADWTDADLAKLDEAAHSGDAETSARARESLRRIGLRLRLGAEAMKRFPEVEEAIFAGDETDRVTTILGAARTVRNLSLPDELLRRMALNAGMVTSSRSAEQLLAAMQRDGHPGLTPLLSGILLSEKAQQRRFAAVFIHRCGTDEDNRALLPSLRDPDATVRTVAVTGVGTHLRGAAAADVKPLLQDADSFVRLAAVCAVGLGSIGALAGDLVPLLQDADVDLRLAAARSLGQIRALGQGKAVAALLQDPESRVRAGAVAALGEMGAANQAPAVSRLLKDADAGVRGLAVKALRMLDAREHLDAAAALLADPDENVRRQAAIQLGLWGARRHAKDFLPLLDSDKTGGDAIRALRQLEAKEFAPAIMAVAEAPSSDDSTGNRGEALTAVGALGAVELVPRIVELLKDPNEEVVRRSIGALARLGAADRMDLIVPLLSDDRFSGHAGHALRVLGNRGQVPAVIGELRKTKPYNHGVIVGVLGALGGDEARQALLEDLRTWTRNPISTAWALSEAGRPEDAAALLPLLEGQEGDLISLAVAELAARGGPVPAEIFAKLGALKSRGARVAMVRLGRTTPGVQAALLDELLQPVRSGAENEPARERMSFSPEGASLMRALEAIHEPQAFAAFEKEIVLEKAVDSLDDLRDLLRASGLTLDVAPATRWGRLPKGLRITLRAACEWMLDENTETELLPQLARIHIRHVVLQGTTVKLLRLRRQVEYWKPRLEGR